MRESSLFRGIKLVVFDFDGVFTDNTVYVNQDGTESVRCWRSDGLGLSRLKGLNIPIYIISTEQNPVVQQRAKKLQVPVVHGVSSKGSVLEKICRDFGVDLENTLYVGNDINDIEALKLVGVPVAVADAYPEILPFVKYQTIKPGGFGAVREICDLIYNANI